MRRASLARSAVVLAIVAGTNLAGWALLAAPSQAAGTTLATVTVSLSPSTITADGSSTSTATATVNGLAGPVSGETVTFTSSDPGETVSPTTPNSNGTYTATITSSTTVGTATITATDPAAILPSGTARLTQTAVASPPPPPVTTTTATTPSPAPPPVTTTATTTTSGPTPAPVPTTRLGPSPTSPPKSTTMLITVPTAPLTNQRVTLIATVTSSSGAFSPSGTVSFERGGAVIGRCGRVPVATLMQSATVTCKTSLTAASTPQPLVAVFTAASGSLVPGSTSATDDLLVGRDPTSIALDLSNPTIKVGSRATYTATVAPRHAGPAAPSGSVRFLDRGSLISSCAHRALVVKRAVATATCTITYHRAGRHLITARYRGDARFRGSRSSAVQPVSVRRLPARARGTVTSTMRWTFYYTPAYTKVLALLVRHASAGMTVMVRCHGRGCPFAKHATAVTKSKSKSKPTSVSTSKSTSAPPTVDLVRSFRGHRLHAGARLSVALTRRDLIGKSYVFTIRAGHAPRVQIRCLAPGGTRPGAHC